MGTIQINTGLVVKKNSGGIGTSAQGMRRALGALFGQVTPGVPAPGRLGDDHFTVAGTAEMKYAISPGYVVITRATQGVYIVPLHEAKLVDTDPASGVNPRIDRIYVRQPDPELDGIGIDPRAIIGVAVGLPAASPELPSLPAGTIELRRCVVPAGTARTDTLTFTDTAPVTSLSFGGTIPVNRGGTGAATKAGARANFGFLFGNGAPANTLGEDGDSYDQIL